MKLGGQETSNTDGSAKYSSSVLPTVSLVRHWTVQYGVGITYNTAIFGIPVFLCSGM